MKFIFTLILLLPLNLLAESYAAGSPKEPWPDLEYQQIEADSAWDSILMWFPNRFLDFIDMFKADVGIGTSLGAVVRFTPYAQAGFRSVPFSLRAGNLGRRSPIMIESCSEAGLSPDFKESNDRRLCSAEIGIGVDLLIPGAYVAICPDEMLDFALGIFLIDYKGDDR